MSDTPFSARDTSLALGALAAVALVGGYLLFFGSSDETVLSGPISSHVTPTSQEQRSASPSSPRENASALPTLPTKPGEADQAAPSTKPVVFDPAQALAEAVRESDPQLRRTRIMSVLREWAAIEPDAAARAAMAWPGSDRVDPVAAVFGGVAGRPDDALRLGTFFCREDPAWAPEHGRALIDALAQAGQFSAAVSFALVGGAEVDGEERNTCLTTAFAGWAQHEPQLAALAATSDLPENGMQQEALIVVVSRWRKLNPEGPEKFLAQLPPGRERNALAAALAATTPH
jgi:hypothetical protein